MSNEIAAERAKSPLSDVTSCAHLQLSKGAAWTEAEIETVGKVCEILGDRAAKVPEMRMCQFVRGYSYEEEWAEKVAEMLTKCLDWRDEERIDTICERKLEKRDVFTEMWKTAICGKSDDGRLVVCDRLGGIDPNVLLENFDDKEVVLHHVQTQEFVQKMKLKEFKQHGHIMYKSINVLDLNGLGMAHTSSKFRGPVKGAIDLDQWYYPESLHKLIMANSPWVFSAAWRVVKPWLHPITQEKISVVGGDYKTHLAEIGVHDDALPDWLEGTGTDLLAQFMESWKPGDDDEGAAKAKPKRKTKSKKKKGGK